MFDQGTFDSSPIAEIVAGVTTYDPTAVVSDNINILTSTYQHLLIVERGTFGTTVGQHYPRTPVSRLGRVFAKVGKYEKDRTLTRIISQNNGLTANDDITIQAATAKANSYGITLSDTTFSASGEPGDPSTQFIQINGNYYKTFYEGSSYKYTLNNNSHEFDISFFSPGDASKQKQYFDVRVNKVLDAFGNLDSFTIYPDSSDLTEYVLRFTNFTADTVVDVHISTLPEPINGEYKAVSYTHLRAHET